MAERRGERMKALIIIALCLAIIEMVIVLPKLWVNTDEAIAKYITWLKSMGYIKR